MAAKVSSLRNDALVGCRSGVADVMNCSRRDIANRYDAPWI
jgi:hypothetical protein